MARFNSCEFCGQEIEYAKVHLACCPEATELVMSIINGYKTERDEALAELENAIDRISILEYEKEN